MTHCQPQESDKCSFRRLYIRALGWVLSLWVVGVLFVGVIGLCGLAPMTDLLVIAVASGAIACFAMLPGLLPWPQRLESDSAALWQRLVACLFAGIVIRLAGTVALFLTCRYHMATSTEMIAGMTIGWYVPLTSLEVFALARELPKAAKASNLSKASLG